MDHLVSYVTAPHTLTSAQSLALPHHCSCPFPCTDKDPSSPEVEHEDVGLMQAHEYQVEHPVSTGKGVGVCVRVCVCVPVCEVGTRRDVVLTV